MHSHAGAVGTRKSRVLFLVPAVLRGNPYLGWYNKTGMHSHAGAVGTRESRVLFLVPTVLRGNPYLGWYNKTGMHSHAGAMGTRKILFSTVLGKLLTKQDNRFNLPFY